MKVALTVLYGVCVPVWGVRAAAYWAGWDTPSPFLAGLAALLSALFFVGLILDLWDRE